MSNDDAASSGSARRPVPEADRSRARHRNCCTARRSSGGDPALRPQRRAVQCRSNYDQAVARLDGRSCAAPPSAPAVWCAFPRHRVCARCAMAPGLGREALTFAADGRNWPSSARSGLGQLRGSRPHAFRLPDEMSPADGGRLAELAAARPCSRGMATSPSTGRAHAVEGRGQRLRARRLRASTTGMRTCGRAVGSGCTRATSAGMTQDDVGALARQRQLRDLVEHRAGRHRSADWVIEPARGGTKVARIARGPPASWKRAASVHRPFLAGTAPP